MKKSSIKELFELDNILVDIASTIINYRVDNNLSQQELADKLGCKISKIKDFESGDYNFTVIELWTLSKKLNLKFSITFEKKKHKIKIE